MPDKRATPDGDLVGRAAEQAALAEAITALGEGSGRIVLISGEPGIGKSTLARWAAAEAARSGYPVYWGFCWEAGGAPAFWPWSQCLSALLADGELPAELTLPLSQLIPELQGEPAGPSLELQPEQARFRLLEAMRSLLDARSAQTPFVLVLEDLHAADRDSLQLLQFLGQHTRALPLMIIGTFRDLEAGQATATGPLWRSLREAAHQQPARLDEVEVLRYLQGRAGEAIAAAQGRRIYEVSQGNPLFLSELVAVLSGKDPQFLPENLRTVIRTHLDSLPARTIGTLGQASVLGREFDIPALAAMTGVDEESVAETLQAALQAGVIRPGGLDRYRFDHVLHRDVLYAALDPPQRRKLHLRRADHLRRLVGRGQPDFWAELAVHLQAAGSRYRVEAVAAWRQAACRARQRLAFDESVVLFSRALEAFGSGPGAEPADRCALMLEAAEAHLQSGGVQAGRELCREAFELALTLEDTGLIARAALAYGSVFVIGEVDPDLVEFLRTALAATDRKDEHLRPRLQARLAAALQPAPDPRLPMDMAREAVAHARSGGDERVLYETLTSAISALMDFAPAAERVDLNREYADLALRYRDIPGQFRGHLRLLIDAAELADRTLLLNAMENCTRIAKQLGLPHYTWRVKSCRCLLASIEGDFEAAAGLLDEAGSLAARAGDESARLTLAIQRFGLLRDQGSGDPAELAAARRGIDAAFGGSDQLFAVPLIATHLHAAGEREAANELLAPAMVERLFASADMSSIQLLGEFAVQSSDEALADRALAELEPFAGSCGHMGLYGMVWHGPVALTLGRLLNRRGAENRARACLEQALNLALAMRAAPLVGCIREELDAGSTQPPRTPDAPGAAGGRPPLSLDLEGDFWRVGFRGEECLIRNSKGMRILARLIGEPDRELHVLDLNTPAGAAVIESADTGAGLDARARGAYKARLEELTAALEEAREMHDTGRIDQLLAEQDMLHKELSRAFGLGGRRRRTGSAAERARVNVTRRVREAISRIGTQLPDAGKYLDNTIKTGTYCKYTFL
jgi:hypothetical protein